MVTQSPAAALLEIRRAFRVLRELDAHAAIKVACACTSSLAQLVRQRVTHGVQAYALGLSRITDILGTSPLGDEKVTHIICPEPQMTAEGIRA